MTSEIKSRRLGVVNPTVGQVKKIGGVGSQNPMKVKSYEVVRRNCFSSQSIKIFQ